MFHDTSIDEVFLGYEGTELCYYNGDGGRTIGMVVQGCVGERAYTQADEFGRDVDGTSATGRAARPRSAVGASAP